MLNYKIGGTDLSRPLLKLVATAIVVGMLTPAVPALATSLSLGGGGGSSASSSSGSATNTTGSSNTSGYTNVLTSQTVSPSGAKLTAVENNSQVSLNIPSGAFANSETVTLTENVSKSTIATLIPSKTKFVTEIGVTFSGSAPTEPLTLTIKNASIPANAQVFELENGDKLVPLQAKVINGEAIITFNSDPDFVILAPTSPSTTSVIPTTAPTGQGLIAYGDTYRFVPLMVHGGTTYVPIWYVMQMLKVANVASSWNGHDWDLMTVGSVNLNGVEAGQGTMSIYLDGKLVQHVTGIMSKDPFSGHMTTFMPIWYVMKVLKRVDIQSTWNGTVWKLS